MYLLHLLGKEVMAKMAADRRAGKGIPHVGRQPRDRNKDGSWRKKRSDAGKPRRKSR
jgi:hypothetical protein